MEKASKRVGGGRVTMMIELLQSVLLTEGRAVHWVWRGAVAEGFSVKKAYDEIRK